MCIPNEAVCDGESHCPFGDDEQNCKECNGDAKMCGGGNEGICLPKRLLCDGFVDCHFDGSDEKVKYSFTLNYVLEIESRKLDFLLEVLHLKFW